jgi:predicted N-acyltransferase
MLIARIHSAMAEIPADAWDHLRPDDNPFLAHSFLDGLERHGCIRADLGWHAAHVGLYESGQLVAAAPLYLKTNSHGEFVFDWSWANAYERHGSDYYPKLLCAVPYSPVTGPRLLVGNDDRSDGLRRRLISAIERQIESSGLSSAHLNFGVPADAAVFAQTAWLPRFDWQFHWTHRGWHDFDAFLASLTSKKRKNIRQERAQVARAGIHCETRHGDELDASDWRVLHKLYQSTFDAHGNHAALTESFFAHLGRSMPRQILAVLCRRDQRIIAAAIYLRSSTHLYGRYWGCAETIPGLHFEACYYQGIEYCLQNSISTFEPGAQGEHKIARGFLPTRTQSFHYIADPRFRRTIGAALLHEAAALDVYREQLWKHSPYLQDADNP